MDEAKNHMAKTLKEGQAEGYQQINYFSTFDLGCSAALISAGFELDSLDKENPRKVRFIFCRKAGIDEAVNDYFSSRLEVSARALFDNIKMLKNRIYSS